MKNSEVKRFATLYERHLKRLRLQGKSESTIAAYSRAVRRVGSYFDCLPGQVDKEQLEDNFLQLVESHSRSTVKLDRLGRQFFWKHVLEIEWQWLDIKSRLRLDPYLISLLLEKLNVSSVLSRKSASLFTQASRISYSR